ncbi:MAG TPA: tyrosine-protein phosphatase [Acidisphaera sp.]|nr:tyrosine-protein phosphatase [Acidisphaera sp.]
MSDRLPRSIALEGATNVRDLGGYVGAGGRRVRSGVVFRSASLAGMTPADIVTLDSLGLRTVCDLRGVAERSKRPAPLESLPHVQVHSLPIEPRVGASVRDLMATEEATGEDVMSLMRKAYLAYAREFHFAYAQMFRMVANAENHAVLFHCSAGKDRTGFGAALLLTSLGVAWEDVLADYMATNELWQPDAELLERIPPPIAAVLLRVHEDLLTAAFDAIREHYGMIDTYLEARLGMGPRSLAAWRDLLLES